jgi:putative ABC transport system permease protein
VVSTLNRKLLRDLKGHWAQFAAITAVILCGIAALTAARGAIHSLKATRDSYYAACGMADFWVYVEKAPANAVRKFARLPGVRKARGRIVFDVPVDIEGVDVTITGRVISMPVARASDGAAPRTGLLDIELADGRYFTGSEREVVIVNRKFAEARKLTVGSSIHATLNDRKVKLKIVGIAQSPEYVYTIRGRADFLPDPKSFGILWVRHDFAEDAFDYAGAANSVVGTLSGGASIDEVLKKAERIFNPYGFLMSVKRKDQLSHRLVSDEIEGGEKTAAVTPTVFLLIAAMVIAIMLSRMVNSERTQIGVMMAMGYSRGRIVLHYLGFSLVVGILGAAGGLAAGYVLAGEMARMYRKFYSFPLLIIRIPPGAVIEGAAFGILFSLAGGLVAVRSLLGITPAAALRTKPPKAGRRLLIERMRWLWRRLPFRWKMIVRNMGRHKVRVTLALFGIAVSAAILIFGYHAKNSMDFFIEHQYHNVQREDISVQFSNEKDAASSRELRKMPGVRRSEPILEVPAELRFGWKKKIILLTGLERTSELRRVLDFSGRRLRVPESGLVLEKHVADFFGLGVGDVIQVKPLIGEKQEKDVRIKALVEEFLGMAAYMEIGALSRLAGERRIASGALLTVDRGELENIERSLKDVPAVASSLSKKRQIKAFNDSLKQTMNVMTFILIFFAAVISFAIVFTMTTVSINERARELASLRVIGLSAEEVAAIVFNENFLVALLGIAVGLPLGHGLCHLLSKLFATDLYRFPVVLEPYTFFMAAVLVFIFVLFSNWVSYRKVQRLDMVEVMKTRE